MQVAIGAGGAGGLIPSVRPRESDALVGACQKAHLSVMALMRDVSVRVRALQNTDTSTATLYLPVLSLSLSD